MRIKFIKDHKDNGIRAGQVHNVDNDLALDLIKSGHAIKSKDITNSDEQQAGVTNGKSTKLRSNK
jgi:hypothetical protein